MARQRYRRKRFYTTPQRILIHLSSESRVGRPGPLGLTQDGIASATLSGRPTITKWLARLGRRGLVVRERARFAGHPLPRHVYRLSDAGWKEAERIRAQLKRDVVEVMAPSLGSLAARVSDVPSLVSPPLPLATAISLVREGRVDLHHLPPQTEQAEGSVVWGESVPQVERLFGRERELRSIDDWYASDSKALLVTGLPGIGKSAIVARWIQRLRGNAHVFWFQVERSSKVGGILADLGAFLARLGRRSLAAMMAQDTSPKWDSVRQVLREGFRDLHVLVALDGAEHAERDLQQFIRSSLGPALDEGPSKIVVISRRAPSWFASSLTADPRTLTLEGLDRDGAMELLRHRGPTRGEAVLGECVLAARGHPLLLSLMAERGPMKASAVADYLEGEVWHSLPATQRSALEISCVFRRGVPDRLLTAAGARTRALRALKAKNLLERTIAGRWIVHDLVREFVLAGMSEERLREVHRDAAKPLLSEGDPRDRWEGVYHLLAAGLERDATSYLDSAGAPLVDSVAAAEVESLIRARRPKSSDPLTHCVFSEIAGDSLRIQGHWRPAVQQYEHAIRMADLCGQHERIPRLLRNIAFIERCRNRYPRALGRLVEAQARLAGLKNPAETIEVKRETALVEQALGDLAQASYHLGEAVDLATEISDHSAISRALLALSSLETLRGHRERGLDYSLEALRIAERSGNLTELARAHIVVGTALHEIGRPEESLGHYEKGMEVARLVGNLRLMAYASMNQAAALLDLARYADVGRYLAEAEGHFQVLEERDSQALLKIYEGQWAMGLGHWQRAKKIWEEGLSELERYGGPTDLARALFEVGRFHVENAEPESGGRYLEAARQLAVKIGNSTLVGEIESAVSRAPLPEEAA